MKRTARVARGLAGVAALLAAGQVAGTVLRAGPELPSSAAVLARMGALITSGGFLADIGATLAAWAGGLLIALVIAVPAGLVLGSLPVVSSATRIVVEFLRPIPAVALIPLALFLFADTGELERLLAAYGAVWPILINTVYAVGTVDPLARDTARSLGLGRLSIAVRVVLPSVAPFAATGLRVASAIALIIPISTEMVIGGTHGIGVFVVTASGITGGGRAATVFAAAAITGLIGWAIDHGLRHGQRRVFRWHFQRLEEA